MIDTQLIMLEGLPSTGKSTNSDFLRMQLERNGKNVKWIHEVTRPHPTLLYSEACLSLSDFNDLLKTFPESANLLRSAATIRNNTVGIDLLEIEWNHPDYIASSVFNALKAFDSWDFTLDRYEEAALDKWGYFCETAAVKDTVYILDSSFFQAHIFVFLWDNAPYQRLATFVRKVLDIVRHLNPSLIYLYRENIESTIGYLEKDRGTQSLEKIWERDKARPYYQDKPEGAEGFRQFLRDYAIYAKHLFDSLECRKLSVEISRADWKSSENEMLSFLEIENMPVLPFLPSNGIYVNDELKYEIIIDGFTMTDPDGKKRRLTPKSANEFYVECLPMVLCFDDSEQLIMTGIQICVRWSTTGTIYKKRVYSNNEGI